MIDKLDCDVVRDLMPLYIDKVCSESSTSLVREHLNCCDECRGLYAAMSASIDKPERERVNDAAAFKRLMKLIAGIAAAALMMGICIAVNLSGAWMGGPAGAVNLFATIGYIIFFASFSIITRRSKIFSRISFLLALLTLVSSLLCFSVRIGAEFMTVPSVILSIFSSVPFYGLRYFLDWTLTYASGTVISLIWVICEYFWLWRNRQKIV
ncbi:MAG: zf-HC2 domain-containing protein [Clostridiales bacterium]|nr:zf-HC2 domain-containing protein [Clostridiales bacterium]